DNRIYVTNIDSTVDDIDIITYFSKFGEIEKKDLELKCSIRLELIHKKKNAFITYINEEDAISALSSPTKNVLGKGDIHIELWKSKKEQKQEIKQNIESIYKDYNLKIKLPKSKIINEKSIFNCFKNCGQIYSIYIQKQKQFSTITVFI
ncbi:hypothetical protein EDI_347720, partial [Entamoeba dispar SAW760]